MARVGRRPAIGITYHDGVQRLDGTKIDKAQAVTESAGDRRSRLAGELAALHKARKPATLPASAYSDTRLAELLQNVPVTSETVESSPRGTSP